MTLHPTLDETLARARSDLRMGLPVRLQDAQNAWLMLPTETASEHRLRACQALGDLDLAVTARRAETLKARAYDGTIARIQVPEDAGLAWVQALADPADDLAHPLRGPLPTARGGDARAHKLALDLCKAARLLPAALVVPVPKLTPGLTTVPLP
ncbi:MAG: hypothetical protein ACPGFC_07350 [Paracoccaceae bacterium]